MSIKIVRNAGFNIAIVAVLISAAMLMSLNAGADKEDITVNSVVRNNDFSYFDISITTTSADVPTGTYPGWCVERGVSIANSWPDDAEMWNAYDPGHPWQTYDWPSVNWLVNEYDCPDDYEYSIIQMAIWGILGFTFTDSEFAPLSTANKDIVDGLIDDALDNDDFVPTSSNDVIIYIIHVSDSVQRTIIEVPFTPEENDGQDDTVWAYGSKDTELWDLTQTLKNGKTKPLTDKWGWYFPYTADSEGDTVVKTLYGGAGQNILTKGWVAGTVEIWNDGDIIHIDYILNDDVYLTEAHVWVDEDEPDTAAPGQFPYKSGDLDFEDGYSFEIDDFEDGDSLYIAVHGVAWDFN